MKKIRNVFIYLTIFSIAMGLLEAAVVIYMRELYYPGGFDFPMRSIKRPIVIVELWRELATLVMLLTVGFAAARNGIQRLSYFIFCFGIWDIFYYVFLKAFINWPESVFTWDVLFLIPLPWLGPVLAPCILSATMIMYAVMMVYAKERNSEISMDRKDVLLFIAGSLVLLLSFMYDYIAMMIKGELIVTVWLELIPDLYQWWIFIIGEVIILIPFIRLMKKSRRLKKYSKILMNGNVRFRNDFLNDLRSDFLN